LAILKIHLLPPLAVARLGSSPEPMENYELQIPDAVSPRRIVPAETFLVDHDGKLTLEEPTETVSFRDSRGRIRPVAPFFELWAETDSSEHLAPLTRRLLDDHGLSPSSVRWAVTVANNKVARRTGDREDGITASIGPFSDHCRYPLLGESSHFLDGEKLPFGWVQYINPDTPDAVLRIRFTPAHGKVYGTRTAEPDDLIEKAVFDPAKTTWRGYREPGDPNNDFDGRSLTNPNQIFAGYKVQENGKGFLVSYGYIDDECDGIIEAEIDTGRRMLRTFARVAAGPPTFAPDSKPVRSVGDELEQALLGPDVEATQHDIDAVKDIVRRALETVRLMNTGKLNAAGDVRGVGMARMDILDRGRKSEPIFEPLVADALAIRARHERVLLGLESGSLAWFARALREYDKVGDLTDEGRRKMPGMMRGADGRHLALTRRQVSRIRAVAEFILHNGRRPASPPAPAASYLQPLNRTAQLHFRARGNPPSTQPDSAISNAYPGLEMDYRNVWRRILEGIVLHESFNMVVEVERKELQQLLGKVLFTIDGQPVTATVTGPDNTGKTGPLADSFKDTSMALEWSNALAAVWAGRQGSLVPCVFRSLDGNQELREHFLRVRPFFEAGSATIARQIAEPGDLTQSLCAPWQNDYRECACFYWAASRPDYVNVETRPDGSSAGHNWMQKDRKAATAKVYINDDWQDDRLFSHPDLVRDWERLLRFVIANRDEPPVE
jgi:hypothetical protein